MEIDLDKAVQEFMKYTSKYDQNDENIKRKIDHSLRVMEKSKPIAESLELKEEDIELAQLIGLLHDIGRFEQEKIYKNFVDYKTIDHGDLGAQILSDSGYIRNYIKDDKYDEIILKAIRNHNKYSIEQGLNKKELLFAKIIRDADKLDILYEAVEMFWNSKEERDSIENSKITPSVWKNFKQRKLLVCKDEENPADKILRYLAFVFDINFQYTYDKIKEDGYPELIVRKFNFKNEETKKIIQEALMYL